MSVVGPKRGTEPPAPRNPRPQTRTCRQEMSERAAEVLQSALHNAGAEGAAPMFSLEIGGLRLASCERVSPH